MESIFSWIKDIAVFSGVLGILIIVHEWGHYITARKLKVRVEKFSIGFGPKLFSFMHDETEFMVSLIPLGGFVKMAGDERDKCAGEKDEFYSKSPGHRSLIVLNGPVVNYALAFVALVFVFLLGYPDLSPTIGKVMDGYPAAVADLKIKDRVIKIDSKEIKTWTHLQEALAKAENSSIRVTVLRAGQELERTIVPKVDERKNVFGQMQKTKVLGIQPSGESVLLKYGLVDAIKQAWGKLWEVTVLTYKSLYFMLTGSMSAKDSMTGPIGIFYIVKSAAEMGFSHLLYIIAMISASLAIFNLLPIIPLDGGHLLLFAIEKIKGKALSPKVDEWIAKIGFGLIISLAIFVFYSDFARFGFIDKIMKVFQ